MVELVTGAGVVTATISAPRIDLESTLDGGQAFRWYAEGGGYRGVIGGAVCSISPAVGGLAVESTAPIEEAVVRDYLGLRPEFDAFRERYLDDPVIGPALRDWAGLRVLRQDPWECLVAFITSATSNIPRIKLNVGAIAAALGERIGTGERDYRFPEPETVMEAGETRLRELGFGFRAPYIVDAATRAAFGDLDLAALRRASFAEARAALTDIHGIGEKIADCVLAFSLDKPEAFPVDRWIQRALAEWYGMPERMNLTAAADWARDRFGRDAVYVNQHLFHRQRMDARRNGGWRSAAAPDS